MTVEASVRFWHDEEGWGVLDSAETPGGCWVFWGHIDHDGFRTLVGVDSVQLDWEEARQDGYRYTAVRVRVPGRPPASRRPPERPSFGAAYSRSLTIEWAADSGAARGPASGSPPGPRIAG